MGMLNRHAEPKRYKFSGKYIPENFDKLLTHFKAFLVGYIKDDKTDLSVFDYNDIIYCIKIGFVPEDIAKDIKNTAIKYDKIFNIHKFKDLLGIDNMVKTSHTYFDGLVHILIYIYKAKGIFFEVRVPKDDKSEFDMSINLLDSYGDVSVDEGVSSGCDLVRTKADTPTTNGPKDSESEESKVNEAIEPKVDKPEEEKLSLSTKAEKAITAIDLNYTQYKNTLRSLGSDITKEDVERLEALAKTIRTTSYSIARPTTPENALESLMAKGIIKPEFKMAFNSMFDNLIKDPLRYFFAKYEGAKFVEHKEKVLTLDFQFERKLYSMYFDYTNLTDLEDKEKLATLCKEALTELYQIREHFLRDLLGATGDLITYLKLVENRDVDNDNLSPLFYDYVYNKIVAFKTLASTYEADVFANNPTVAKCKEMESSIDEITTKIQEWLTKSKTEIAKLFYTKLV